MIKNKSILGSYWEIKEYNERLVLSYSQKNNISPLLSKLLLHRNINNNQVENFLYSKVKDNIPDPFLLKDMQKAVERTCQALIQKETIGIIADYDVDGSTSASILFKFLKIFNNQIIIKTPHRLSEGYGPNTRIMEEFLNLRTNLIFTLDCGTSSFEIIDNINYSSIDVIVIDHHLSENSLPKVHSIINPNRYDENNTYTEMAAVGVTFLFIMALRKHLRKQNFFNASIKEPNILSLLDLVALGTICDLVNLTSYNRIFVKEGLEIIKNRKNKVITKLLDNSNLKSTPTAIDLGYVIGPQLNAASRIDDSSLPSKLLTSENDLDIESISSKLNLLNKKRKLIENSIFDEAISQAEKQKDKNYILIHNHNWHNGVLGIIASRILSKFHKPTIVISFNNSFGIGSARSINSIDLGKMILNAKNEKILINGGGHKMAAGLKIDLSMLDKFNLFLEKEFSTIPNDLFTKIEKYDSYITINEINNELLDTISFLEPCGSGNPEPKFILNDLKIDKYRILKDKHILIFFQNSFSKNLRAICFNCIDTLLGDYLLNFNKHKLLIGCTIKKDNFNEILKPQIIIKDVMIIN